MKRKGLFVLIILLLMGALVYSILKKSTVEEDVVYLKPTSLMMNRKRVELKQNFSHFFSIPISDFFIYKGVIYTSLFKGQNNDFQTYNIQTGKEGVLKGTGKELNIFGSQLVGDNVYLTIKNGNKDNYLYKINLTSGLIKFFSLNFKIHRISVINDSILIYDAANSNGKVKMYKYSLALGAIVDSIDLEKIIKDSIPDFLCSNGFYYTSKTDRSTYFLTIRASYVVKIENANLRNAIVKRTIDSSRIPKIINKETSMGEITMLEKETYPNILTNTSFVQVKNSFLVLSQMDKFENKIIDCYDSNFVYYKSLTLPRNSDSLDARRLFYDQTSNQIFILMSDDRTIKSYEIF